MELLSLSTECCHKMSAKSCPGTLSNDEWQTQSRNVVLGNSRTRFIEKSHNFQISYCRGPWKHLACGLVVAGLQSLPHWELCDSSSSLDSCYIVQFSSASLVTGRELFFSPNVGFQSLSWSGICTTLVYSLESNSFFQHLTWTLPTRVLLMFISMLSYL